MPVKTKMTITQQRIRAAIVIAMVPVVLCPFRYATIPHISETGSKNIMKSGKINMPSPEIIPIMPNTGVGDSFVAVFGSVCFSGTPQCGHVIACSDISLSHSGHLINVMVVPPVKKCYPQLQGLELCFGY